MTISSLKVISSLKPLKSQLVSVDRATYGTSLRLALVVNNYKQQQFGMSVLAIYIEESQRLSKYF
jgi:hypothetical protein